MVTAKEIVEFIGKRGSARTPEIAEHFGIDAKSVPARLTAQLKDGTLVSCKVERPGQPSVAEYRQSTGGQSREFVISATKPPKMPSAPPRTPAHKGAIEKHNAAAEANRAAPVEAKAKGYCNEGDQPAAGPKFWISDRAELSIVAEGSVVATFDTQQTMRLYCFLVGVCEAGEARHA